jgi:succinate dehydrogenase / fumarate reductase cytochrome b subunit
MFPARYDFSQVFLMNASTCSLCAIWNSSIGKKLLVALTGLVLVLFLAGHLGGNLLIFVSEQAFNDYAKSLHELLHGAGVWIARVVLLTCLVIHVVATISLTRMNRAASPKYVHEKTIQASRS